jgi:hypothetical protein
MEGLEAAPLTLSASESSSRKIRSDIKWRFKIEDNFFAN